MFCANHSIDEVYNTKFLDIIEFVNVTIASSLERFAPDGAIKIWNVFLPKPDVPPAIAANYRKVKVSLEDISSREEGCISMETRKPAFALKL